MISVHIPEEVLQQLHDGELPAGEQAETRQHLQSCEQCRLRLDRLGTLHELIGLAAKDMAAGVDFDALYTRITQGVEAEAAGAQGPISLQGWRDRLKKSNAQVWMPMAVAAAVVIAVIAKVAMPDGAAESEQAGVGGKGKRVMMANAPGSRTVHYPAMAGESEEPGPNSEISQVDFGQSNGTLFEIALAEGVSTPVVWINDEPQDIR